MRIAVSGSHRTGKSTLVAALSDLLPGYAVVEEPYYEMLEDGYLFAHPPLAEDFEAQLDYWVAGAADLPADVLCERCPADFLAYLAAISDEDPAALYEPAERARAAMAQLDLIVYLPIEVPDRVVPSESDDGGGSRTPVDEVLRAILTDDPYGFDIEVLEVGGTVRERVASVVPRLVPDHVGRGPEP